jgi:hypothetical protein
MEQQVHEITDIPIQTLRGDSLSEFSFHQRMSWAANRNTTREEDQAYCLLGIFDIHMPLIYGEGRKKALDQLQREFQNTLNPASLVSSNAPWIVPFERNPRFTGREPQLNQLEEMLFTKGHTRKVAVTGLGGVWKTPLVLELLYRTKDRHKHCSIIWIPATNMESLHVAYLGVAQKLGISGWDDEKADVKKLV